MRYDQHKLRPPTTPVGRVVPAWYQVGEERLITLAAQSDAFYCESQTPGGKLPTCSVVVPVYYDELSIERTFHRLKEEFDRHADEFSYEIILVNDGSTDNSLLVLEELHRQYPDIAGVVNLARNFGQVSAMLAGMEAASGDCVAAISSDLQDPPELIAAMVGKWKRGAQAVLGVREQREDPLTSKIASAIFYRLMQAYGLPALPRGGFDFFLLDRRVVKNILNNCERNSFLQGQILSASGDAVAQIPYRRTKRQTGKSGWTVFKKIKYFVDAFVAYSYAPVRFISTLGILLFFVGILLSTYIVVTTMLYGTKSVGWSSVMVTMLLLSGIQMMIIGVLGEYLWRTLDQVRARPLYLVDYRKLPGEREQSGGAA